MRFTSTLTTLTLLTLSFSAGAKGNKNLSSQGGPGLIDRTVGTYTSPFREGAKDAGDRDYATATRELEALDLKIGSLQTKFNAAHADLLQTEADKKLYGPERKKEYLAMKSELGTLQTRADRLNEISEKNVKDISEFIKSRDAQVIASLKELNNDHNTKIDGEDLSKFATATLARFELSDLKSNWQAFANKAGDAQAALEVVKAKLDQSILGTYINNGVLNSPQFCSAVKAAAAPSADCNSFSPKAPAPAVVPEKKPAAPAAHGG